ncbi:MAG: AEC family transporter [Clostridia bacterium]|nr:AEC family transporter [Clostridia bacterium]
MLSNLNYSINAVMPILLLVILGIILKRIGFLDDAFTETAEKIVFKISLPVMLFLEVAGTSLDSLVNIRLILFCVITVTASFIIVTALSVLLIRDRKKRGSIIQGVCRSNFAILGVPIADNMFGSAGISTIACVMPFVILMFNSYSVVALSLFTEDKSERMSKKKVLMILKNIVTNPLIIGVFLAVLCLLFSIELPAILNKSLNNLSNLTTPLALICLGAKFKPESLKGRVGYAVCGALGKTVILPAIMVAIAALFGFRDAELGVVLILFGAPSAVSSYIMAKRMKNDAELSAQILLLSTIICIFTIFIGIFTIKTLNLI